MELKKNPRADLERRYSLHLAIGFVISITMVITAFEWVSLNPAVAVDIFPEYEYQNTSDQWEVLPPVRVEKETAAKPLQRVLTVIEPSHISVAEVVEVIEVDPFPIDALYVPPPPDETAEVFDEVNVDEKAMPQGGWKGFREYLTKQLKYPRPARQAKVEGKVFVMFIVDGNGVVTDAKVIKGIGFGCDEEALRVISNIPPWTPASRGGLPVAVRMVIPIHYKLN